MFFWRDSEFCPQEKCKIKIQNIVSGIIPFFYFSGYGKFFNITPRHPPRTFPLGLRVPSLGGVYFACERLKYRGNEPFEICPHFLGRGSVPLPSGYAYPSSRFQYIFCGVAFALKLRIAILRGTRPLAVATLAEMSEGGCRNANALDSRPFAHKTVVRKRGDDGLPYL